MNKTNNWPKKAITDLSEKEQISLLKMSDRIVVSVSGGKDSSILLEWAVNNLPKEKLVAVHAAIDIDWPQTKGIVEQHCERVGVPLVIVQATFKDGTPKGIASKLVAPRIDRKTGKEKENQWPGPATRWCTAEMKTAPIDKFIRTLTGSVSVLIGERREESNQRAKLDCWRPDEKLSKSGRDVVKCSPILDVLETTVWEIIKENKIPVHPCYSWGVSRASCAICIFSKDNEIAIAQEKAPEIVQLLLDAEKKIVHTFRYKPATKKRGAIKQTIAQILKTFKIA